MALTPFPDGWYFLARADEVKPGTVLTRRLAGEDVVLFRGRSGALAALRPYCPHMGAHLGHGGRVEGDELRCPMHHFCFDTAGTCTRAYDGKRAPPKARLSLRPVVERQGLVLVWHASDGHAPTFEVPDGDVAGLSSLRTKTLRFAGHPQETSENSVDLGHLSTLHGFFDVEMVGPLVIDGAHLHASFAFSRRAPFLGRLDAVRIFYTAHVHGLGVSIVDVEIPELELRTQQLVLATPTDVGRLALTIGVRAGAPGAVRRVGAALGATPRRLVAELLSSAIMFAYAGEVGRDVAVWEHKRYLESPMLADGDGPIARYRKWARQFDPRDPALAPLVPSIRRSAAG